jgi:hypothetical protein
MPTMSWICNLCNRGYGTREEADKCEGQHVRTAEIAFMDHRSHHQDSRSQQRLPKRLLVKFNTGLVVIYQYKEIHEHYLHRTEKYLHRTGNSDAGRHPQGPGKFPSPEPERRENLA